MSYKFVFVLYVCQWFAESSAYSDPKNYREASFPWMTDRPAALSFNGTNNEKENRGKSSGEKTRGGSRNETEEVTESDFQSADIFPLPFRNLTVEEKVEPGPDADLGEKPEKRGFSYRKRTKQEEDYDYFYEYETGDYFWKRKSVRVVLPKGKSGNGSRAGSTEFSTVSPEESERKLDTRFGSDFPATKIPDSETSLLFDPVEFDEKYFSCPDNFNGTYPITGYCNRYVSCVSGKAVPAVCKGGLHFDVVDKKCDLPRNSFCNYACPKESGYFGIPGECNGFFSCRNWYPRYRTCPPHKHWDPEKEICTDEESSRCPLKCEDSYRVKPYEGDCRSYVICEKSVARYRRCPAETRFDLKSLGCVPRNSSECSPHPKFITFKDYPEKNICSSIGIKGEFFTWCKETPSTSTTPDFRSASDR